MAASPYIRQYELGLRFKRGELKEVLGPGKARVSFLGRLAGIESITVYDTLDTRFTPANLEALVRQPDLAARLEVVRLGDTERALVWREDRLKWILGPGLYAFWKAPVPIRVERFDVAASRRLVADRLDVITSISGADRFLGVARPDAGQAIVILENGRTLDVVRDGVYAYWKVDGSTRQVTVDLREQVADVAGQEIMTRDKVTLRMNLVVTWQVVDPVRAVTAVQDVYGSVYREAQLALRAVVGTRTLDKLLADKDTVGTEVFDLLAAKAEALGAKVIGVGVRDVILPGDMKTILNQVITAQKEAEANVIRRREETAAARSQANTARLLAENPELARMRELEALAEVLKGTQANFVLGPSDIAGQVTSLLARKPDAGPGP